MGFAWNLILFSFMREREGYKHHADCTVPNEMQISNVFRLSADCRLSLIRRSNMYLTFSGSAIHFHFVSIILNR